MWAEATTEALSAKYYQSMPEGLLRIRAPSTGWVHVPHLIPRPHYKKVDTGPVTPDPTLREYYGTIHLGYTLGIKFIMP